MSEQGNQDREDRLRGQVWRHLELGQWHSAALLSEHMCDVDPLSSLSGLAEATRALAMISEGIRLNEPVDPYVVVRLDEIGRTWPRLGGMRSFQALVKAVQEASVRGHEVQSLWSLGVEQQTADKPQETQSVWSDEFVETKPRSKAAPSGEEPKRSFLRHTTKIGGCGGITALVVCVLVIGLGLGSTAWC